MTEPKKPSNAGTWIVIIIIWCLISWWWNATPAPSAAPIIADHEDSMTLAEVEDAITDGTADLRESLSQMEQEIADQEYELRRLRSELDDMRTR